MERLGFLIVGNYRGNMQIMYNPNLVSPSQRKLIYEYSDYGYTKENVILSMTKMDRKNLLLIIEGVDYENRGF